MLKTVYIKLPERLQRKWASLAHKIETVNLRRPSLSDFVTFVENESDIANDPTYSKEALTKIGSKAKCSERHLSRGMKQKVSSFETQAKNDDSVSQSQRNSTSCPSCSLDHDLHSCKQFLCKNPYGGKMFVMSKRLCFGCCAPGHNIKSCPKIKMRQKEGCGGDHPAGLHGRFKLKSKDTSKSEHERCDGKSDSKVETKRLNNGCTNLDDLSCNLSECNGNFMSMSIVSLVLFHKDRPERKIKAYGMLDNCSQGTFIRNDVLEFLDTSVVQTTITVRTMLGSSTEKSCAIEGLKVRSINGTTIVDLPKAYSQQSLPVDQNEIPTKECLKQWPNLYEIADEFPEFDADVPIGLLIGPTALRPIKVVKETNNGPFAQKNCAGMVCYWSYVKVQSV